MTGVLEGIALVGNPKFAIIDEVTYSNTYGNTPSYTYSNT